MEYENIYREMALKFINKEDMEIKTIFLELVEIMLYEKKNPFDEVLLFYKYDSIAHDWINISKNDLIQYINDGADLDLVGIECGEKWGSIMGMIAFTESLDMNFSKYIERLAINPKIVLLNKNIDDALRLWLEMQ